MKYWIVEGWNDPSVVAVQYVAAKHESDALQEFVTREGDGWQFIEAGQITKAEFNALVR
jgi:hypothetical protein